MKKKLIALRVARGKQIDLMEANKACSTEAQTGAYEAAKAELARLGAEIVTVTEALLAEPETEPTGAPGASADAVSLAAATAERTRVLEINRMVSTGRLEATLGATHIERGTSIEGFRSIAFAALAARQEAVPTQEHHADITLDAADKRRGAMTEALLNRINGKQNAVDAQNGFRGMSLLRMAEESLQLSGRKVRGLSRAQIAELAMQSTGDFPYVLENTARKQLLKAYDIAQPTYRVWAKSSTSPDFKTMTRTRLSEMPVLLPVEPGAQITIGRLTDSKESYALATAGRGVSMTRQSLINDDLGAFNDEVFAFGLQCGRYENKAVYGVLAANAALSDSVALFHATHNNLGAGVIANAGLDAMFTAMGTQKGLDGVTILNLEPKYLIVPKAKEATAKTAMTAVGPSVKISDQNWFAGRLEVVADGELDASSNIVWYGACDPNIAPLVEYCHLEGAEGPQLLRTENESGILGIQLRVYLDFAAKAVDWRSGYKSTGA